MFEREIVGPENPREAGGVTRAAQILEQEGIE
jgi:hypothetical protein